MKVNKDLHILLKDFDRVLKQVRQHDIIRWCRQESEAILYDELFDDFVNDYILKKKEIYQHVIVLYILRQCDLSKAIIA